MYVVKLGSDIIKIDETNLYDTEMINIPRVHLIKMEFSEPDEKKVLSVISLYPKTNRFIVKDNIKIYNSILRKTSKKYYVENRKGIGLISFLRKNNKVLLNFFNLSFYDRKFLLSDSCFNDLLMNVEVIAINKEIFEEKLDILKKWSGNVIIYNMKV